MNKDGVPPPPPPWKEEGGLIPIPKRRVVKKIKKNRNQVGSPSGSPPISKDVEVAQKRHIRMLRRSQARGIIFENESNLQAMYINNKVYIRHSLLIPMQPPPRRRRRGRANGANHQQRLCASCNSNPCRCKRSR